ncbi:MAG TPA: hypothetical protein VGT05_03740 [Patescibacteria group bacterium]|nr:hypothetical protein [Patescibacteria group bacterium]
MKRSYLLLTLLGAIVLILAIVQISVSNMLTTGGIELSNMQQQIADYERRNAILQEKIYTLASLTNIQLEAQRMGFTSQNQTPIAITDHPIPLAIKP